MIRNCLLLAAFFCMSLIYSQNHDFHWLFGDYWVGTNTNEVQNISIDFRDRPASVNAIDSIDAIFYFPISVIADEAGENLLFYSNGCEVKDRFGDIMPHGDTLTPGFVHDWYCDPIDGWNTYPGGPQSILSLPQPGSDSLWYLFHKKRFFMETGAGVSTTYASVIDMSQNDGKGDIIAKSVLKDTLSSATQLTAARTADLSGWWLNQADWETNYFRTYLLDSTGLELYREQEVGLPTPDGLELDVISRYSPDGTVYAMYNVLHGLRLYDFDRETGELSNPRFTPSPPNIIDSSFYGGIEFSPSGRFLYIGTGYHLFQLDLEDPEPATSLLKVASMPDTIGLFLPRLIRPQLGPDCRLYVFCISCSSVAIVHRPDEKGAACMVEQQAIQTPTSYFRGVPIYPKYRMKAVGDSSSICDHVTQTVFISDVTEADVTEETHILLYPNPVRDRINLVFSKQISVLHWQLVDAAGRVQQTGVAKNVDAQVALSLRLNELSNGTYWLVGQHGNGEHWRKGLLVL